MSAITLIVIIVLLIATIILPQKWAPFPLIIAILNTPYYESVLLGNFRIHIIQILCLTLLIRLKNVHKQSSLNSSDYCMIVLCLGLIIPAFLRPDPGTTVIFNTKIALTYSLGYLTFKRYVTSIEAFQHIARMIAIAIIPLALEMILEKTRGFNYYSIFPSISPSPKIRNGALRANGTFSHAILAGTAGATCLFIAYSISEKSARISGILFSVLSIVACASSGPIAGLAAGIFALKMRKRRKYIKNMLRSIPFIYIALEIGMTRNPIYIISKIDFTGSSTSWYRSRLIESGFEHISEWWLSGTDYTRHWMPSGVSFSLDHTDITSHYIQVGVWAGIIPFCALVSLIIVSFKNISTILKDIDTTKHCPEWAMGAALFSLTVSMTCVSLFDNSIMFLLLLTGSISSLFSIKIANTSNEAKVG